MLLENGRVLDSLRNLLVISSKYWKASNTAAKSWKLNTAIRPGDCDRAILRHFFAGSDLLDSVVSTIGAWRNKKGRRRKKKACIYARIESPVCSCRVHYIPAEKFRSSVGATRALLAELHDYDRLYLFNKYNKSRRLVARACSGIPSYSIIERCFLFFRINTAEMSTSRNNKRS